MTKRINITLSDNLNFKLDSLSERYGVGKSSIVAFVIGQWVDSMEKANDVMYGKNDENGAIFNVLRSIADSQGK